MKRQKPSRAEQIRRLKLVTNDEDKYFSGVLGNPVTFSARWGLTLSKRFHSKAKSSPELTAPKSAGRFSGGAGKRIRIRLKAFDHRVIDQSAREIADTVRRTGARMGGVIPTRTRLDRFTVQRPAHSDKKSQETFEQRTHRRLIDILNPTSKTMAELKKLNLPAGVDITIKI